MAKGKMKLDGSGRGKRNNVGRGDCAVPRNKGQGRNVKKK